MVTSSAVVGSSAMSSSGSLASAMAIITRWRWPPEADADRRRAAARGRRMPTLLAARARARAPRALACRDGSSTSATWRSIVCSGLSEVIGSWKTMRDVVAAHLAQRGSRSAPSRFSPLKQDRARRMRGGRVGEEPQDRQRRHRSCPSPTRRPAPPSRLADVEGYVLDRMGDRCRPRRNRPKVLDRDEGRGAHGFTRQAASAHSPRSISTVAWSRPKRSLSRALMSRTIGPNFGLADAGMQRHHAPALRDRPDMHMVHVIDARDIGDQVRPDRPRIELARRAFEQDMPASATTCQPLRR